jgi:CheY-like chemotaxis protein
VMSKILVEMMGGSIGVESTVGVGSVFWFELDSAAAPSLAIEGADLAGVSQAKAPLEASLRTLLYVEDNAANLKLVEQLIARRSDLRLLSAGDGRLGIEMARASLPDVILMDINLPGIDGFQALKILREDPATADIPVLAISASAMLGDIRKGLEAGFFRYLTKPIHVSEFMDAIDAVLEIAGSRRTDRTT